MGVSDGPGVTNIKEGCNPGTNVLDETPVKKKPTVAQSRRLAVDSTAPQAQQQRVHQVGLVSLDLLLNQIRNDRQIAILKLDVEGMEIKALRGARSHLHAVQNIIQEVAPTFLKRMGTTLPDIINELRYLQDTEGFEPFLLYTWQIPRKQWRNTTHLTMHGIEGVYEHPLDHTLQIGPEVAETLIVWKIVDWDKLLATSCSVGCNIWFTRMTKTQGGGVIS
jgi:hypothetical protein